MKHKADKAKIFALSALILKHHFSNKLILIKINVFIG